jgi:rod shape-determining protein MreC
MALLSVTIITLDAKDVPILGSVRSGMMQVLEPIGSGAASIGSPLRNAWNGVNNYEDLQAENEQLRQQLDELEGNVLSGADAREQVQKLREQLGVAFLGDIPVEVAQVSTGNFSSFDDHTTRINKGSDSGVQEGMAVVTASGLIGRVERVSNTQAVVRLITDPDVRVGVRLKSNDLGVGRGTGPDKPFLVDRGIGLDDEVNEGDPVTTSGLERAQFPPEIPIGVVENVTRNQAEQSQILEVQLAADLSRLDYVQVLKWLPEQPS